MAKVAPNLDFTTIPNEFRSLQPFVQMLAKDYRNLAIILNYHVGFGDGTNPDNIDGVWANVTAPATPNTNFTVTHNLGRVPIGYLVVSKDRACDVFTGTIVATKSQITLQAGVASAVLRLFIF